MRGTDDAGPQMPRDLLVLWAHDLDPEHTVLERIRENVGVFAVLNVVKTWIWKPFGRIRSTSPRDYHGYALSLRLVSALYHMFRLDFDLALFADTRLSRLCPASIVLWPGSICFCFEQQRSSVAVCLRRFAWGLGTGVRLFFFFFFFYCMQDYFYISFNVHRFLVAVVDILFCKYDSSI